MKIKYPELFEEFVQQGYDLIQLEKYIDFICECKEKDIINCIIHKHHILPRCMGGSNKTDNLISLDIRDHCLSHLILADCFDKSMKEWHKNITSSGKIYSGAKRLLEKYYEKNIPENDQEFWNSVREKMKEYYKGINVGALNPMYGKVGPLHPNFGKPISEESKQQMINTKKERFKDPEYRKAYKKTEEFKQKMSKIMLENWEDPEFAQKYIDSFTEERRKDISDRIINLWKDVEYKEQRMKSVLRGENHPMYGKPGTFTGKSHTEETKEQMSRSAINSWTIERRNKASEIQKIIRAGKSAGILNNNSKFYVLLETGEIFHTRLTCMESLQISDYKLTALIKSGEIIKKTRKEIYGAS